MTLLGQEDTIEREASRTHPETTVREEIYRRDEKFTANLEQKKCAVTAFFEPVWIALHELFDLGVCKRQMVGFRFETTEHFVERKVFHHFVNLHSSCFGRLPSTSQVQFLKFEINVAENVGRPGKSTVAIGWPEDQLFSPGTDNDLIEHVNCKIRVPSASLRVSRISASPGAGSPDAAQG
jgi:hypothetical protein